MASTCIVSGTIIDISGDGVENATIRVYPTNPFVATTDYVISGAVETSTNASGDFSFTVVRTVNLTRSVIVEVEFPDGETGRKKVQYSAVIPDSATANFEDIISTP